MVLPSRRQDTSDSEANSSPGPQTGNSDDNNTRFDSSRRSLREVSSIRVGRAILNPQQGDNVFVENDSRPSCPILVCLLMMLAVLMLLNLDGANDSPLLSDENASNVPSLPILPSSGDQFVDDVSSPFSLFNSVQSQVDLPNNSETWPSSPNVATYSFPTASFTLKGYYATYYLIDLEASPNSTVDHVERQNAVVKTASWVLIDEGKMRSVLLTRPSVVQSVRLATVRIDLQSSKIKWRQSISLAGLDLRDVYTLTFQGVTSPATFSLPEKVNASLNSTSRFANLTQQKTFCQLLASLRFDKYPQISKSVRPIETQRHGGNAEWGFDQTDFGNGGEWERRRLETIKESSAAHMPMSARKESVNATSMDLGSVASGKVRATTIEGSDNTVEGLLAESKNNATVPMKNYQDLEGVIVSPNCGIRILLAGEEVDLVALANRVIHFAFFFVVKGLLEVRYFLCQVHYTENGGSSVQKVCYVSLGLHISVDCFEAILLLTEAVEGSFMTTTFVILAVFKLMFVAVVELRYLVIVLKSRYDDTSFNESLSLLVKIHAAGTSFLLIGILKLLPIFPHSIMCLYLVWLPQIIKDVWKGNRRSLSPQYVIGMSACHLLFPLYLWGCPVSFFNGEIFKALPGAPSLTLSLLLIILMAGQVALLLSQYYFGPRKCIPMCLLPNVYNYYRPVPKLNDQEGNRAYECVICMTEIGYVGKTLVTTPCDHHFHEVCLQQWMDIKAECPTCRRLLPPFP